MIHDSNPLYSPECEKFSNKREKEKLKEEKEPLDSITFSGWSNILETLSKFSGQKAQKLIQQTHVNKFQVLLYKIKNSFQK
jgi:hypothetical protein